MPDHGLTPIVDLPHRHDGWTAARQRTFLFALADTGCVGDAAAEAGMSARSAYRLRRHENAVAFAQAWDQALVAASQRLAAIAYERAINGTPRDIWHKGEKVGEERRYNDRLLMFLLNHVDSVRYGRLSHFDRKTLGDPRLTAERDLKRLATRLRDAPDTAER